MVNSHIKELINRKERIIMILKKALELTKSIEDYRLDMDELAKKKGFSNPDEITISQKLDQNMLAVQKILYTICPPQTGTLDYQNHKHS
jgi:cupin superfamily acireductone dioxygenase involved in methionine salvage